LRFSARPLGKPFERLFRLLIEKKSTTDAEDLTDPSNFLAEHFSISVNSR
jgi:hypothetical protein